MPALLVVFRSLSQVYLVKKRLMRAGLYLDMVRVPQCAATRGCSFALRCSETELSAVKSSAKACDVEPAAVIPELLEKNAQPQSTEWQDES